MTVLVVAVNVNDGVATGGRFALAVGGNDDACGR